MLQTPSLIPLPLSFTVVLHHFRVRLATLFLILRMFVPPLLLAFTHDLAIFRISRQFLAVIICATPALALWLAADLLLGTINRKNRRQKGTLAVKTAARLAQAHSSGIAR